MGRRREINIERGRCEERLKYEDRLAAGKKTHVMLVPKTGWRVYSARTGATGFSIECYDITGQEER